MKGGAIGRLASRNGLILLRILRSAVGRTDQQKKQKTRREKALERVFA